MMSSRSDTILPYQLRANDLTRHIVNIDSRFRDTPTKSTASDFYFSLLTPVRNVLRIRVSAVEFPNNYFFFTRARQNVHLTINYDICGGGPMEFDIPDGNYTTEDMTAYLQYRMDMLPFKMNVDFNQVNGAFTFTADAPFNIDTVTGSRDRIYDYGLGFYLGFTRDIHRSMSYDVNPSLHVVMSDTCAYFAADNYVFLRVNDYGCVRQTVREYDNSGAVLRSGPHDFTALAKLIMIQQKNYMTFDDYTGQHIKEYVFPAPVDLSRLHIQVLDKYGDVMDLCASNFSFSLEVTEVRNLSLYNTIRDSLATQYL